MSKPITDEKKINKIDLAENESSVNDNRNIAM